MTALTIREIDNPYIGLGIAAHFLARRTPFSGFRFGDLVQTLDVQLRRHHARFAFEGERVVGYIGWALYDTEDAQHFARTGQPPPLDRPDGADVLWVLTVAAVAPQVAKTLTGTVLNLNVGKRVMGVRYKPSGKRVVFDQPIRPRKRG